MSICKEKPDMLPPLDAIGLEPSDQSFPMPVVVLVTIDKALSVTTSTPTVAAPAISTTLVDHMNVLHTLRNRRLAYSRDSFVTFSEALLEAPGLEDDLWCNEYTGLKR
jgi:hypothetical protein